MHIVYAKTSLLPPADTYVYENRWKMKNLKIEKKSIIRNFLDFFFFSMENRFREIIKVERWMYGHELYEYYLQFKIFDDLLLILLKR